MKVGFLTPVIATCLVLAPAASSTRADNDSTLTIRLISSPSGFEHFQDRPPHGVDSKGDFYRAGSILRNAVPQFGKAKGARVGTDDFLIKYLSTRQFRVRGRTTLPGGLLRVDTLMRKGQSGRFLPVTGGTGDFEGARGTMETIELSGFQRAVNVYRLRLP